MNTDKIIIVGGGSAGWMTAATLVSKFPEKDITVIEDPGTSILGVGESTIGQIRKWLSYVGIDELDFVKETDAIIKLSIKFTDFHKVGESFHYPFGEPYIQNNLMGTNDWWYKKIIYPKTSSYDYADCMYPAMSMINNNTFSFKSQTEMPYNYLSQSAFHFDAAKFGVWLKDNFCKPKGVKHVLEKIKKIEGNQFDGIKQVNGHTADLYIDCTGRGALLSNTLGHGWLSYQDILPNDRAVATRIPYKNKEKEMVPYTNCTAVEKGWVWNIPLWSRIGTGFVYSSDFMSKEEADEWFRNYLNDDGSLQMKHIEFPVGIRNKVWAKNCVAIGMAAGFIEPLESSGLYTVHEFLIKLCRELEHDVITDINRSNFNHSCHLQFREFAEFVSTHYALSKRQDSDYWKFLTQNRDYNTINLEAPEPATHFGLKQYCMIRNRVNVWPQNQGISCIAAGMNWAPTDRHAVLYENNTGDLDTFIKLWKPYVEQLDKRKKDWDKKAKDYESYYDFIKNRFYAD